VWRLGARGPLRADRGSRAGPMPYDAGRRAGVVRYAMTTTCEHIEVRDGVPYIAGTTSKVEGVVINHLNFGWDGLELQAQLPHLTLGQVYAALGYYYDHKDEMDVEFERGEQEAESLRSRLEDPALRAKLLAAKRAGERG
jgi:uncharacterized protein (DUF433 family)